MEKIQTDTLNSSEPFGKEYGSLPDVMQLWYRAVHPAKCVLNSHSGKPPRTQQVLKVEQVLKCFAGSVEICSSDEIIKRRGVTEAK